MSRYSIVLAITGLLACKQQYSNYCAGAPHDSCDALDAGLDAAPDAPPFHCTSDGQCTAAGSAVCAIASGACVQCTATDATACTGATPVCGSDDSCRACTTHAECASDVCLPDGSCDAGSDVAYLAGGGTGGACTQAAPCGSFAGALATGKPIIKFSGSDTIDEQVAIGDQNVTVFADPGATLSESSAGTILTVSGTSQVAIYGLTISGGLGTAGTGVGIAETGGMLTLERAMVAENAGGGISISNGAQFHIENTFITQNGGLATSFGGVKIDGITTSGTYILDFDTIAGNGALGAFVAGVQCGDVAAPVTIDSDIVYANEGSATQLTAYASGSPQCVPTYSDIGGSGVPSGTGNINADPLFIDGSASVGNFRLMVGSPCIDTADPSATVTIDHDGDPRPIGSGFDMGADEVTP